MARLSFLKLVYRKEIEMDKLQTEYVINKVFNDDEGVVLELRDIEFGDRLFVEVNNNTMSPQLELEMKKYFFDESDVDRVHLDSNSPMFREVALDYLSIGEQFELHAIVEFDRYSYTIKSVIAR